MSDIVHVTDHGARAAALLLEQVADKPRILALLASYMAQVQAIEDVFWDLFGKRWIDTSEGVQLDTIGAIVGEDRQGSLDDEYRAFLRARIRVNRSTSLLDDLVKILALIQDDTLPVHAAEFYPASVQLRADAELVADPNRIARMLMSAKPGGVALRLIYLAAPESETLLFSDLDGGFTPTAGQCLGDYESSPIGGGNFSSVA